MFSSTASGGNPNFCPMIILIIFLTASLARAEWQQQIVPADTQWAITYADSAKILEENGEYQASSVLFQQAADIYQALQRWESYIDCLNGIADNAISTADFDVSDSLINITLPLARRELSTPNAALARTYTVAGSLADELAQFHQAIAYYDTAYSEYVALYGEGHLRAGVVLNNRSLDYRKLGEFEKALQDQQAAGEIFKKSLGEDHYYMGVVHSNLGIIYSLQDRQEQALEHQEMGLAIKLKNLPENHPVIGDSYNNISAVYIHKGEYVKALEYVKRSLEIDLQARGPEHPVTAIDYDNIGIIHSYIGDYQEALASHHQALEIRQKVFQPPHRSLSRSYNNLGLTYRRMGDYDLAIRYLEDALEINKKLVGEISGVVGGGYFDIGQAYADKGDNNQALGNYRRCIDIVEAIAGKHTRMVGLAHYGIAEIYREQQEYDRAIRHYQRSFSGFTRSFSDTAATAVPALGDILLPRELIDSIAGKAAALAERSQTRSDLLPDLLLSNSNYRLALKLAIEVRQSYRAEASKLFLTEKHRQIHEAAMDIASRLYRRTGNPEFAQQAFAISQMSKATILADALRKTDALAYSGIPDRLLLREKELRKEMAGLQAAVGRESEKILEGEASVKLPALEKNLFDKKQQYQKLLTDLETGYAEYFRLRYQTKTPSPETIQQALPAGVLAVDYFLTPGKLYRFMLSESTFRMDESDLPEDFANLLSAHIQSIKTVDRAVFLNTNNQLSKILLHSLGDLTKRDHKLVFLPDGLLHYLPFEVLFADVSLTPENPQDYSRFDFLIKHAEISYHYSAEMLLQRLKRQPSSSAGGMFAGFAPGFLDEPQPTEAQQIFSQNIDRGLTGQQMRSLTVDGQQFSALPYSLEETAAIAALFQQAGIDTSLFLQQWATETALKKAAPSARYLHIASHGILHDKNPDLSGILLYPRDGSSDDGILFAAETFALESQADLVVLSSCESGLGPLVQGEGVMALTRGFLFSGAQNVIISLWKVSDQQTRSLMVNYYSEHLRSGDAASGNFSAALRKAKLDMIKDPVRALPRHWAGFVLIGL